MASIVVSDLHLAGSTLFLDSESFLKDLTEQETGVMLGGYVDCYWVEHKFLWSVDCYKEQVCYEY